MSTTHYGPRPRLHAGPFALLVLLQPILALHAAVARAQTTPSVTTLELSAAIPSAGRLGGVAMDRRGNLYVANFGASVWRVAPDGAVTELTSSIRGTSGNTVAPDGRLLQASFLGNAVLEIRPDGTLVPVVTDSLDGPVGVAADAAGRIWVCNCRGNSVSIVEPDGAIHVARDSLFDCPNGITLGPDGDAYVVSFNNAHIVRLAADGTARRHATLPPGRNAHIARATGALWVTRIAESTLWRVDDDGTAEKVAGTGVAGLEDGPLDRARLAYPNGIVASPDGRWLWMNNLEGAWRGDEPTRIVLRRVGPLSARSPGRTSPR